MPRDLPILFSSPMVLALLAGDKTQTRRIVKPQPSSTADGLYADRYNKSERWAWWLPDGRMVAPRTFACRYGEPGDRLWVRETWAPIDGFVDEVERDDPTCIAYGADRAALRFEGNPTSAITLDTADVEWERVKWKPSIHLRRWASRIDLAVVAVRIERLQDITEADAKAEGVDPFGLNALSGYRGSYFKLWVDINGHASLVANPWVWVIEFSIADVRR